MWGNRPLRDQGQAGYEKNEDVPQEDTTPLTETKTKGQRSRGVSMFVKLTIAIMCVGAFVVASTHWLTMMPHETSPEAALVVEEAAPPVVEEVVPGRKEGDFGCPDGQVDTGCKDKIADCEGHKSSGGCLDENIIHDLWRTRCVKTCDYCVESQYRCQAPLFATPEGHHLNLKRKDFNGNFCFVTTLFWEEGTIPDNPPELDFDHDATNGLFRFIYYTNHGNHTFPNSFPLGWEVVQVSGMPYNRMITKSRWPKFMAWIDPSLENCGVIAYLDALYAPSPFALMWKNAADLVLGSHDGLIATKHWVQEGPHVELDRIVQLMKDTDDHVKMTKQWLEDQPDYRPDAIMYDNHAFIYDPRNPRFARTACFFWDIFSQEKLSWRDQPLWAYALSKFNMDPPALPGTLLPHRFGDTYSGITRYFKLAGEKGFNGHYYASPKYSNVSLDIKQEPGESPRDYKRWKRSRTWQKTYARRFQKRKSFTKTIGEGKKARRLSSVSKAHAYKSGGNFTELDWDRVDGLSIDSLFLRACRNA